MDSILNVEVSCTPNYYSPTKLAPVNLLKWLQSSKYSAEVENIRNEASKEVRDKLKSSLPAILTFGVFEKRSSDAVVKYSNLLCIDIDFKENQHILNYNDLKNQIAKIKNVAYVGLSVSGTGYFVLFAVEDPISHTNYFDFIETYFFNVYKIKIDKSCKDITRLRGYSYDSEAYFNHNAIPLKVPKKVTPNKPTKAERFKPSHPPGNSIEVLIEKINHSHTDITANYADWYAIGCDVATSFGNSGEDYFQQISQYYTGYAFHNTAKQYKACLNAVQGKPASLGALFNVAKRFGILIKESIDLPISDKPTKLFEQLKDGTRIEITPEGYPSIWDEKKTISVFGSINDQPETIVTITNPSTIQHEPEF